MTSTRLAGLAPIVLFVAGCGSDSTPGPAHVDISGMYQVSHHTLSAGDCNSEGTAETSLAYFHVLPTTKGYAAVRCTGADVSSCAKDLVAASLSGDLLVVVDEAAANGWTGTLSFSRFTTGCLLSYSTSSAVLTGSELRIEDRHYSEEPPLAAAGCTSAEALARGTSMPCSEFRVLLGARQ